MPDESSSRTGRLAALGARARAFAMSADAMALAVILAAMVAVRLYARSRGVAFDAAILHYGFQFLDPDLLLHDLKRSLLYLHSQPPLYNLYLGVVLKLFPDNAYAAFIWGSRAVSLAMAGAMYALLRELAVPRVVATAAVIFVMCSPATILYENWLFYTLPVAAMLVAAGWFAARFARTRCWGDGVMYYAMLIGLMWTRSIFHPLWFVVAAALPLLAWAPPRRRAMAMAVVALAVALALPLKNYLLVGSFSTSTWLGMSSYKMMRTSMDPAELQALVDAGKVSPIVLERAYQPVSTYQPHIESTPPFGIPAMDNEFKVRGEPNMNHRDFLAANRLYARDVKVLLRHHPNRYWETVRLSAVIYFKPASEYMFLSENVERVRRFERGFNAVAWGKVGEHTYVKGPGEVVFDRREHLVRNIGFLIPVWFAVALAAVIAVAVRVGGGRRMPSPAEAAILFLGFNLVWVAATGILLDVGENNRFRYQSEPLMVVLAVAGVCDWVRRGRARRAGAGAR